ncbi:MAG: TonB-dependent receptor [Bacteroidales bacterium]|jgi:TonB-linked SusC/RagA family outer membrane protein|nr:TonB-dependent receptor [Bacteroidales bacterium]
MNATKKIIFGIIILFCFGTAATAQDFSMNMKNVTVKQAMSQFTSESGYSFVFSSVDLNTEMKVSVQAYDMKDALKQIFAGQSLSYEIKKKNIILRKSNPTPAPQGKHVRKVTGIVKDPAGETVIGADVVESGTTNGTITDSNGKFAISIRKGKSLQVSCIGYITQTVDIGEQNDLVIVLKENSRVLDEIVVVAFGKMKREAFTGSAGILKSEDLGKAQVSNPAEVLAGRVAGVQLSNSSSQFGSSPTITIRGFGSISSSTSPLIVVDGMPYDGDLNLINPNDIESMTVLKDAASSALYGARGANGVIMVTTKRGKAGAAKISVDMKWGFNSNGLKNYKTTDSRQFYETYYKMLYNYYISDAGGAMASDIAHSLANKSLTSPSNGVGPGYMVYSVPNEEDFILQNGVMNPHATMGAVYNYNGRDFYLQADDWKKEGLQDGFRQEYNITVSGTSDRMNYYTSIGYLNQDGIQEGSGQTRLTARLKTDYQAKKWLKIGANFNYSKYDYCQTSEGTIGTGTIWSTIKTQAPIYPVYLRNADKKIMIDKWGEKMYDFANSYGLSRAGGVGGNCIFANKYRTSKTTGNSCIASGYADINLADGLKLTLNASTYDYDRRYTYIIDPFVDYYTDSSNNGSLSKSSSRTFTYNTQQLLNYSKRFGKHEVSAMIGHEYYDYKYEYLSASGYNFGIEGTHELGTCLNLHGNPNSYSSEYNNEGYFFRGMYNYNGKYYASTSYRRDASSRFSKNHRWGDFWSLGGAWVISKEDFFNIPMVNSLKLKVSVGSQGNDNIGNYYYANTYNIVNNNNNVAYQWRQKGSENITWETNTNWNTGIEFELFNNRLNGGLDCFYRKTSNMLFSLNTPPSIGYTSYFVNLGDMRNTGLELTLQGVLINKKDFRWNVSFNISHVKNKVLKLPDEIKTTTVEGHNGYVNLDKSYVSKYKYFVAEGLSLYTWYLPEYAGVDRETGEALYYKDIIDDNGNVTGRKTTDDPSQATDYLKGDALPNFYGGIGTTLNFNQFDFSINMNYQLGGKAYDYTYQTLMHTGGTSSVTWSKDMLKAWRPENPNSNIPRLRYAEKYSQNARSDRFLIKASYLNIQNINIGYTLPDKLTSRFNVSNMRLYISGENLFFISARRGFDPRYSLKGYTNPELYSPIRTISGGITLTF